MVSRFYTAPQHELVTKNPVSRAALPGQIVLLQKGHAPFSHFALRSPGGHFFLRTPLHALPHVPRPLLRVSRRLPQKKLQRTSCAAGPSSNDGPIVDTFQADYKHFAVHEAAPNGCVRLTTSSF